MEQQEFWNFKFGTSNIKVYEKRIIDEMTEITWLYAFKLPAHLKRKDSTSCVV